MTEGILRAHREGIVTSTTITANMPAAAAAAGRLADAPRLGVGVHLNVSQGPPLTREALALADEDGVMRRTAVSVMAACVRHPRLLDTVAAECEAQIRWALDRGVVVTHLDSHRHVHGFPPIFARVAALARRYDIRFVRWHREVLAPGGWPACPPTQRCVRWLTNLCGASNALLAGSLGRARGTWGIAHTGRIDAAWLIRAAAAARPGVTEIMTHPGLPDGLDETVTRLRASRQAELGALCDPAVKDAFARHEIELVHYGQLPSARA